MASTMLHTQSPKAMDNLRFGGSPFGRRSRLSLVDAWVALPNLHPVRTAGSFTGSSGTPKCRSRSSSLEISEAEEYSRDVVDCETPRDTDHRIPDVDVEVCPPAPKKPRGVTRTRMALPCSSLYEKPTQDLPLSPCYLF